ncbi:MAG: Yip1 family protein [Burkholderiales bacterium]
MLRALRRAMLLLRVPDAEWRAIARESPSPAHVMTRFVLPLACIPAACWSLNLLLNGQAGALDAPAQPVGAAQLAEGMLLTYAGTVLSILLMAAAIFVLAPLFSGPRAWRPCLQVAGYGSAPLLLAGALLTIPELAVAMVLAAFHSMYLVYGGLKRVHGVKDDQAAEYVALSVLLLIIVSTLLGALRGWWLGAA